MRSKRALLTASIALTLLALPSQAGAANPTLTIQKGASTGSGIVTSSPAGIECGSACTAEFPPGTSLTLSATSSPGTAPVQWLGCDSINPQNQCLITLGSSKQVTATFLLSRALTVSRAGAGAPFSSVTSSPAGIACGSACEAPFSPGQSVTLTATPGPHVLPAQWFGCSSESAGKCIVTMSEAKNVTATFNLEAGFSLYPVTVEKTGTGQGTVTASPGPILCGAICSGEFITGSQPTLTATPAKGSVFTRFSGGGCTGTGPCTPTVKKATTIKAVFTLTGQRDLSVTRNGSGTGTVTAKAAGIECGTACSSQVAAGKKVTLSAMPATGSTFAHWSGACTGTAKSCAVTMSEARSVIATFTAPQGAAAASAQCLVPGLKGKSLAKARKALAAAHCSLGRVARPKGARGSLVVRSSSPAAGSSLAAGAKVGVRLGKGRKRR
jgi:hypothetical protein